MEERLHIAVDGGGTKTIAILFQENGEILKGERGTFGSNVKLDGGTNPTEDVGAQTIALFEKLCDEREWAQVRSVTFTIPNFAVGENLERKLNGKVVRIFSDDLPAYVGALMDKKGVCVSAGTGAVIIAPSDETEDGIIHSGAWGLYDDDAGGGYYVGILALRRLFRDVERGKYCLLSKRILSEFGVEPKGYIRLEVADCLYGEKKLSRRDVAKLSLLVKECADEGCEVAIKIFDDCAYRLAEFAEIAYTRAIGEGDCPVAIVGGLKKAGDILIKPFKKYLTAFSKRLIYTEPVFDNYIGSVVLALREIGVEFTEDCLENVKNSQSKVR